MSQLKALLEENDRRANEIKESIEIEKSKAAQQASSSRWHLGPSEPDMLPLIEEAPRPLHVRIEQSLDCLDRRQETSSRTSSRIRSRDVYPQEDMLYDPNQSNADRH